MLTMTNRGPVYVIQAVSRSETEGPGVKGNRAYEDRTGGLATNAFTNLLCDPRIQTTGYHTIGSAFDTVQKKVEAQAAADNKQQKPKLDLYHGASRDMKLSVFMKALDEVLIIRPSYTGDLTLVGAEKDVEDFLTYGVFCLKPKCKIHAMTDSPQLKFPHLNLVQSPCKQEAVKMELERVMSNGKNCAIFVFAHGVVQGNDDEYIHFPEDPANVLSGKFMGGLIGNHGEGAILLFTDMCNYGWPDPHEVGSCISGGNLIARGTEDLATLVAKDYVHTSGLYAAVKSKGATLPPGANLMAEHYANYAHQSLRMRTTSAIFGNSRVGVIMTSNEEDDSVGGKISAPSLDLQDPTPTLALEAPAPAPVAPAVEAPAPAPVAQAVEAPAPAAAIEEVREPLVDRNVVLPAASALEWLRRVGVDGLAWGWNAAEMAGQGTLGTGISYVLGPVLLVLLAFFAVSAGAACVLYTRFVVKNHRATLAPAILVMLITTLLPYMCDPAMLGQFMSARHAFFVGTASFACVFLCVMLTVVGNWKQLSKYSKLLLRMPELYRNSCALAGIALEMYFMGHGEAIQQTMHVRAGGVNSYVVYYPLITNGADTECAIPSLDERVFMLPNATGHSLFNKKMSDGSTVDYTCIHKVYLMRISKRAEGDVRNLHAWIFKQGKVSIPLSDMHVFNEQVQKFIKMDSAAWAEDPLNARLANAEQLEAYMKSNGHGELVDLPIYSKDHDAPTTLEKLSAPFCLFAEWTLGFAFQPIAGLLEPFAQAV
jgi:hypothetical protein